MINLSVLYKKQENKEKNHSYSYTKKDQLKEELLSLLYALGYTFTSNFSIQLPNEEKILIKYDCKDAVVELKWINNQIFLDTGTSFVL